MNFINDLERELTQAGIPARRRIRILAEFSDHLHENPQANLGTPERLAREFADELGTRLARGTAYRAFAVLTLAGLVLTFTFFDGGRTWGGWIGYGSHPTSAYLPGWWLPLMIVWFISAQTALACGVLAALRAWRLRRELVITEADAAILNRRVAISLVSGAITMTALPITRWVVGSDFGDYIDLITHVLGPILISSMLAMLPDVLRAARMRPRRGGEPGDLTTDLGTSTPHITPTRIELALCALITLVMVAIGISSHNTGAGILRGVLDSGACLILFFLLGRYLGLRSAHSSNSTGSSRTRTRAVLSLGALVIPLLIAGFALRTSTHRVAIPAAAVAKLLNHDRPGKQELDIPEPRP